MLVVPHGYCIVHVFVDRGAAYTGSAFREYCHPTAIPLEFAAINTISQIGESERIERSSWLK